MLDTSMNDIVPTYFHAMKPELPKVCDTYVIRQLIKSLNREKCSIVITAKVHTHSFCGFKLFIQNAVIDSYLYNCNVPSCESCQRVARCQILDVT